MICFIKTLGIQRIVTLRSTVSEKNEVDVELIRCLDVNRVGTMTWMRLERDVYIRRSSSSWIRV